jgi:hypothetical protein
MAGFAGQTRLPGEWWDRLGGWRDKHQRCCEEKQRQKSAGA